MPSRKVIIWLLLLFPAISRCSLKVAQADCSLRAAVPSFDQQLNESLMSQVWGLSQLVICQLSGTLCRMRKSNITSPILFCEGQEGCLLSAFPISCDWDRLKHDKLHCLLNHSGLSQAGPEQISRTMYWHCLETPDSWEQVWDTLATITKLPSESKPEKCPHRHKGNVIVSYFFYSSGMNQPK